MEDEIMTEKIRLPSEIPIDEYPPPSTFINEAISCVEEAEKKGITLRIIGGLAIYLHSQDYKDLWEKLGRLGKKVFTDIDFIGYRKHREKVVKFFQEREYTLDKRSLMYYGERRVIFFGGRCPMVDVFFDKLEMNHTIDFRGRLEVDTPTIPPAELLLEKMQIVKIAEKDIKDTIVLLRAHEVDFHDKDAISLNALIKAGLTSDWGFWYTFTTNLEKVVVALDRYDVLTENDKRDIREKVRKIREYVDAQPKSIGWKMRAKAGTKVKWYNDVEDWGT
ncbi:MAG: hypothetical protein QXU45_03215 [Candidatus Bathyarchaeia archaeon]